MCDFSNLEHLFEAGKYSEWMEQVKQSMDEHEKNVVQKKIAKLFESDWRAARVAREEWETEKTNTLITQLDRIFNDSAYVPWMEEATLCMNEYNKKIGDKQEEVKEKRAEIEEKRKLYRKELRKDNFFNRIFKKEEVEKARTVAAKYEKEIDSLESQRSAAFNVADKWLEEAVTMSNYTRQRLAEIKYE